MGSFIEFVRDTLPEGILKRFIEDHVRYEVFDRGDPRNHAMAIAGKVRIVFGSDNSAEAIHALPHPADSVGYSFINRRSEVWLEGANLPDSVLTSLVKVFATYGQTGCTSPSRVTLLNQTDREALLLRDRLLNLWPKVLASKPEPYIASTNIMARQLATALGWDASLTSANAAVIAVGSNKLKQISSPMVMHLTAATLEEAAASLPANIQTIGYATAETDTKRWLEILASCSAKRFVELQRMHHFGPVWDGVEYWRQSFEVAEVRH